MYRCLVLERLNKNPCISKTQVVSGHKLCKAGLSKPWPMNVINKCYKEHKKFYCSVYDYRLDDGIRFLADAKDFFFVASPDQL